MRVTHQLATSLALAGSLGAAGWKSAEYERGECVSRSAVATAMVDTTTDLRIVVNVPAYRLDVLEQGAVTRSIRIAVGQPRYRTPLGHFKLDYAIWNPWWRPPPSAWARMEHAMAPGWSNPVGRVKLHVTGLVFLHGTPLERSLGTAASHACVRMANADAIGLARFLHAKVGPIIPSGLLDSLVADTARTRTLVFSHTVPVDIVYQLAEIRQDTLLLYPDVYRLFSGNAGGVEAQAALALHRAGRDTAGLDWKRLRTFVRRVRHSRVGLPVDSLFSFAPIG